MDSSGVSGTSCNIPYENMASGRDTTPSQGPPLPDEYREGTLRPCTFYLGLGLSVLGTVTFFIGIGSDHWMIYNVGTNAAIVGGAKVYLAHTGPWRACTHHGTCGAPWELVPGLDETPVRLTQTSFIVSGLLHLVGVTLILLPALRPVCEVTQRKFFRVVLPEMVLPVAVVTGFVSMLFMGQLKRRVILRDRQEEAVGSGFLVCLVSHLVTVTGVICVVLNRYVAHRSSITKYLHSLRKLRKRTTLRTTAGGSQPFSNSRLVLKLDAPPKAGVSVVRVQGGEGDIAILPPAVGNVQGDTADVSPALVDRAGGRDTVPRTNLTYAREQTRNSGSSFRKNKNDVYSSDFDNGELKVEDAAFAPKQPPQLSGNRGNTDRGFALHISPRGEDMHLRQEFHPPTANRAGGMKTSTDTPTFESAQLRDQPLTDECGDKGISAPPSDKSRRCVRFSTPTTPTEARPSQGESPHVPHLPPPVEKVARRRRRVDTAKPSDPGSLTTGLELNQDGHSTVADDTGNAKC